MTIQRMDHVGVVVGDLDAAVGFFAALGLAVQDRTSVEGAQVDSIVGLEGVRSDVAMMATPDGHSRLELTEFRSPPSPAGDPGALAHTPGLRHITFAVDDLDATLSSVRAHGAQLVGGVESYGGTYTLCYVRGPEGIIVELAQKTG